MLLAVMDLEPTIAAGGSGVRLSLRGCIFEGIQGISGDRCTLVQVSAEQRGYVVAVIVDEQHHLVGGGRQTRFGSILRYPYLLAQKYRLVEQIVGGLGVDGNTLGVLRLVCETLTDQPEEGNAGGHVLVDAVPQASQGLGLLADGRQGPGQHDAPDRSQAKDLPEQVEPPSNLVQQLILAKHHQGTANQAHPQRRKTPGSSCKLPVASRPASQ